METEVFDREEFQVKAREGVIDALRAMAEAYERYSNDAPNNLRDDLKTKENVESFREACLDMKSWIEQVIDLTEHLIKEPDPLAREFED